MAVDDALALVLILCIVSSLNEAHFTGNQPLLKEKRYSKMQASFRRYLEHRNGKTRGESSAAGQTPRQPCLDMTSYE